MLTSCCLLDTLLTSIRNITQYPILIGLLNFILYDFCHLLAALRHNCYVATHAVIDVAQPYLQYHNAAQIDCKYATNQRSQIADQSVHASAVAAHASECISYVEC